MVITANTLPYTKTKMETGCSREMYLGGMFKSFYFLYLIIMNLSHNLNLYGFGYFNLQDVHRVMQKVEDYEKIRRDRVWAAA